MSTSQIEIEGKVESVMFQAPDTGFAILKVRDAKLGPVSVTGAFPPISKGLSIIATGVWKKHPKYGEQIAVSKAQVQKPKTNEGIVAYLESDVFEGVGPETAKRLVAAFGDQTLDIIRNSPDKVSRLPGISQKKALAIQKSAQDGQHLESVITWLMEHGCGTAHAFKIFKKYGHDSIPTLSQNPWILADELYGIGFDTADRIAQRLGLGGDHPERLSAGIRYFISRNENDGSTAIEIDEFYKGVGELLSIPADTGSIFLKLEDLCSSSKMTITGRTLPDGKNQQWVQSSMMHALEQRAANKLRSLASTPDLRWDARAAITAVPGILKAEKFDASDDQRDAIKTILSSRMSLLIGGPGSGKTTTTNIVVRALRAAKPYLRIRACAPTGKAAQRVAEQTGLEALTIHRLIGWGPGGVTQYHDKNPLDVDFLLVDETSMMDTLAAAKLLAALPAHCCILFVGDPDQLPSVGAGSILSDFIRSGLIRVCRLTTIHRQAAGSAIIQNAYAVRDGRTKDVRRGGDFSIIECDDSEKLAAELRSVIFEDCGALGFNPGDIQIITAGHRAATGTKELNTLLQKLLNEEGDNYTPMKFGNITFKVGDKIIVTKNDYDLKVFNGSMGIITGIFEDGTLTAVIDGELVKFSRGNLGILSLAYALTVHKCQGSEFPCVILVVDTAHFTLLDRHWLYTGLTRAKKHCVLATVPRAVGTAIRNVAPRKRNTLLVDKLAA